MKIERIAQLELLLRSHPEGLRRIEIAKKLGMHRSSIGRYINDLKEHIDIYEKDGLIKIKDEEIFQNKDIFFSIYESLAFNISAELLAENIDIHTPHLASGLRKIALSMKSYAPQISNNILDIAAKIEEKVQSSKDPSNFKNILEILIDSWVTGKIVKIEHKVNHDIEETEFAPYFIGFTESENRNRQAVSVTGRIRHTFDILTIDIRNIISATILDEVYNIPDNLKPFKRTLKKSVSSNIDMIHLTLELKEKSAINSLKKLSHSEFKISKSNNKLICEVDIEDSTELFLRIIQSGDSINVLKPIKYRKKIKNNLEKILKIYS